MGDDWGRGVAEITGNTDIHLIGGKYLQGCELGRPGQGMSVHTHIEWAAETPGTSVFANGLADSQDVALVKAVVQRRSPVARGAEGHHRETHPQRRDLQPLRNAHISKYGTGSSKL